MIFKGVTSMMYQHHLLEVKITAENQEINTGDQNKIVDIEDKRLMSAQMLWYFIFLFFKMFNSFCFHDFCLMRLTMQLFICLLLHSSVTDKHVHICLCAKHFFDSLMMESFTKNYFFL